MERSTASNPEFDANAKRALWLAKNEASPSAWDEEDAERCRKACLNMLSKSLGKRYHKASLANYQIYNDDQRAIVDRLREIVPDLAKRTALGEGLIWHGLVGTGKDHMMAAMLIEAARAGLSCRWVNGLDMHRAWRDAMDTRTTEREVEAAWIEPAILAISDPIPLVGELTDFQVQKIHGLVDARYRQHRSTWITTNQTDIKEAHSLLTSPVFDRLRDGAKIFACKWRSWRRRDEWGPTNHPPILSSQ